MPQLVGQLNWSIQLPVRPEGLIVLALYLILVGMALFKYRRSFLTLNRRQWWLFAGLALATIVLSNMLLWRFSAPTYQPVPNRPQEASVPLTPLLSAVPVLLAANWLGIGPALALSTLSGFLQAGFQSGELTQRFEVIAFGLIAAWLMRQNYRGRVSAALRHPIIASPLAALISWPIMLPSFYFYTPGDALTALNYAWPLFLAGLFPTITEGLIGGIITEGVNLWQPQLVQRRAEPTAAPWARTLTSRMVWAFATFVFVLIIVLLYAVSASALGEAKRQAYAQMSRDALSAAREVPSFFHTGQGLIGEFALDEQLRSPNVEIRQARLLSALRTGPFFDQLLLFDANGRLIDAYPPNEKVDLTTDERTLISRTLQTSAPQQTFVFALNQQSLISFVAPVSDSPNGEAQGALLGRTRLQVNPIIVRLREGLQNTLGSGTGYLVDENSRIVVHHDIERVLSVWSLDAKMQPVLQTPDKGAAFEDRFPDGTPRLLFVQPAAGTNWLVVIELPVLSVLQLAMQISTPMLALLLILGVLSGLGVALVTRAIARPIEELSKAAAQIAQGKLDQAVVIKGEDEVGELGRAFEQMRVSLKDRVDDLSLLLRVSQTVSAALDLERGVPPLLAGAMQASPAKVARLVLLSETGAADAVISNDGPQSLTPLDKSLALLATPSEEPILIDNVTRARSRAMLDPNLVGPGIRAIAVLPVRRQAHPIGVVWLGYSEVHNFSKSEVDVLGTLAGQAAVLIENARLFQVAEGGRRRLQAVLSSTSDAVIVTDKDNRVLLCNPAAEVAFRLPAGTAIGQLVSDVWPDLSMARLFDPANKTKARTEEVSLNDGRTLYGSASAIISGDNQVIGRVAVLRDITHLKELDAMKTEFVATVSHDLRAPLTYMRGYATMLPMVGSLTPKQQDYVEKVMAGIEQMTELIDDLLDLGRIDAGVGMVKETCSLADIARTVVDSMGGQSLSRGLTLATGRLSERTILGDQGLLRHAITNLVDNAIKYTPSGGTVTVGVEERGDAMVVTVKDTGIGIAPADQVRLFERFYRVKRRETIDIKGTGLGLAIVKSIAEWHRGRVWVESQLGEGSTFYILLPLSHE
ncbi:MAG: ATP-binding protein [Anaerolineae bacterium]